MVGFWASSWTTPYLVRLLPLHSWAHGHLGSVKAVGNLSGCSQHTLWALGLSQDKAWRTLVSLNCCRRTSQRRVSETTQPSLSAPGWTSGAGRFFTGPFSACRGGPHIASALGWHSLHSCEEDRAGVGCSSVGRGLPTCTAPAASTPMRKHCSDAHMGPQCWGGGGRSMESPSHRQLHSEFHASPGYIRSKQQTTRREASKDRFLVTSLPS